MGVAAYNRGNRVITAGIYGFDRRVVKAPQPRPSSWGDKALAKATQKARGCLSYMTSRGHVLSIEDLADMVQSETRWARATCEAAARTALTAAPADEAPWQGPTPGRASSGTLKFLSKIDIGHLDAPLDNHYSTCMGSTERPEGEQRP